MFAAKYGLGKLGTNNIAEMVAYIIGIDKTVKLALTNQPIEA